jgi:hypothetical protein
MTSERTTPVGLGLRALKGGAVVVGVAIEAGEPRLFLSTFLATAAEGDRLAFEPYHVAAETGRGASADAASVVAEGRRRQDRMAAESLRAIIGLLGDADCKPVVAALLVNRAGWITDLLEYSTSWQEHLPVAEGLAVRDALRFACRDCQLEISELDEKSLPERAAETLDMPSPAIDARLKTLGAAAGRPWRKEQKLACLAAWTALSRCRYAAPL